MNGMDIQAQFQQAVADSKGLKEKPSNETLLQLYALYKQGTEGDMQEGAPANPFDFVARAKQEAWSSFKGLTQAEAMQQYIQLVEKLKA